ncbi:hypothetical protein BC829DRAFT_437523 [Chytridium lagenaria]|nr:hypothetical protein BC829DRAFT_437523 [Chytridium lagenaria]
MLASDINLHPDMIPLLNAPREDILRKILETISASPELSKLIQIPVSPPSSAKQPPARVFEEKGSVPHNDMVKKEEHMDGDWRVPSDRLETGDANKSSGTLKSDTSVEAGVLLLLSKVAAAFPPSSAKSEAATDFDLRHFPQAFSSAIAGPADAALKERPSIYQLEIEESFLTRLEREYADERKDLLGQEDRLKEMKLGVARLVTGVEELQKQLTQKKNALEDARMALEELEAAVHYSTDRVEAKKSCVRQTQDRVADLRLLVKKSSSRGYANDSYGRDAYSRNGNIRVQRDRDGGAGRLGGNDGRGRDDEYRGKRDYGHDRHRRDNGDGRLSRDGDVDSEKGGDSRKRGRDDDGGARYRPSSYSPTLEESGSCYNFNRMACREGRSCSKEHICILCGGVHGIVDCQNGRNVCVRWNMTEECVGACNRDHRCLRCMSSGHKLGECPVHRFLEPSFVLLTTLVGFHKCMRCRSSHPATLCPDNVEVFFVERGKKNVRERIGGDGGYRDVKRTRLEETPPPAASSGQTKAFDKGMICRDFNNGRCTMERCKFKHVCMKCGSQDHRERRCGVPPAGGTGAPAPGVSAAVAATST